MRYDPIALLTGYTGNDVLSYGGFYIVPAHAPGKVRVLDRQGRVPLPVGLPVFDSVQRARQAIDRFVRDAA
jgi:hypothetical protein